MTKYIVITVCEEMGVDSQDFFGRDRSRELVNARREAIVRLIKAGFSMAATARLIKKSYSTVQYWLKPDFRAHRARYGAANNHRWPPVRKKMTDRVTSRPEQRAEIVAAYQSGGVAAAMQLAASYKITRQSTFRFLRKAGIYHGRSGPKCDWASVAARHQPVVFRP